MMISKPPFFQKPKQYQCYVLTFYTISIATVEPVSVFEDLWDGENADLQRLLRTCNTSKLPRILRVVLT